MMENTSKNRKIVIIAVAAVLLLLCLLFGLSRCGIGAKDNTISVFESQDNSSELPKYDEKNEHVFSFIPAENAQGDVTYELVSQKDQDFKDVDYFTLVNKNDTQIKVKAGTPAGVYTLTIRANATGDSSHKEGSKDITYIYTIEKADSSYSIEPTGIAGLVYNGKDQELMKAGSSSDGKILYKVNDGEWSETIPTGLDAGIYTVSYKLVGDRNHADIKEKSVMVSIDRKAVAYKPGVSLSSSFSLKDMRDYIHDKSSEAGNKNIPVSGKPNSHIEYEYDGRTHSNGYLPPQGIIKMGDDTGINAGTYVAIYYPDINYCWSDGSRNPVAVTMVINRKKLTIPTADDSLVYNGETQTVTLINFDETLMSVKGTKGKNAGEYKALVCLKDRLNYSWSDGSILDKIVVWHIAKGAIDVPYVETVFTFNGLIQDVDAKDLGNYDRNLMSMVSGRRGYSAGDYNLVVALKDKKNYVWNDEQGGSDDRTIVWTINRKPVCAIPEDKTVEYDGKVHSNGFVINGLAIDHTGGPQFGKDAGTYVATYKPKDNYCWDDGTYDEISLTLTITKAAPEYIIEPKAIQDLVYNGKEQKLMKAGVAKGGEISYKLNDGEWTNEVPAVTDAGIYIIEYKIVGDENHSDSESTYALCLVYRATPVLTKEPVFYNGPYDGNPHNLVVEDGEATGGRITYFVNDHSIKIEDLVATEVGDYDIEVIIIGTDTNWGIADCGVYTAHITAPTKKAEFIDEPQEIDSDYDGSPHALVTAGTTNDGTVMYSLDGENYSEEIPTATDADVYTVYYYIKGDAYHADSDEDAVVPEIKKVKATATVESSSTVYNGQPQDLCKITSEDGTLSYTTWRFGHYDEEVPQRTDAGKYTVYYKVTGDKNHLDTYYEVECTIENADIVYEAESAEFAYEKGKYHGVEVTAETVDGSKPTIKYGRKESAVYSRHYPKFEDVGEYVVYFTITADNHNPVKGSYTVTIKANDPVFIVEPASLYEDNTVEYAGRYLDLISAGKTNDGKIEYKADFYRDGFKEEGEYSRRLPKAFASGTYVISYRILGKKGYNDKTFEDAITIEVVMAEPEYVNEPEANDLIYTGEPQDLVTAGKAKGGDVLYRLDRNGENRAVSEEEWSEEVPQATDAGTYYVWYYIKGDVNHKDSEAKCVEVKIAKADPRLTTVPEGIKHIYDDTEVELLSVYGVAEGGEVYYVADLDGSGDKEYRDPKDLKAKAVKTDAEGNEIPYEIRVYIDGDENHSDLYFGDVLTYITKTDETVYTRKPSAKEGLVYSGGAQDLVNAGETEDGTILYRIEPDGRWSSEVPTAMNAGKYTVSFYIDGDESHEDSEVESVEVEIGKANATATVVRNTTVYNGQPQDLVEITTEDGTIKYAMSLKERYVAEVPKRTDAGTYDVYYKIEGDENHNDTYTGIRCTIEEAEISYSIEKDREFEYDPKNDYTLVVTAKTVDGYTDADTRHVTITYGDMPGVYTTTKVPRYHDAGEYTVYFKIEAANHRTVEDSFTFQITPADIEFVAPKPLDHKYTGGLHVLVVPGAATTPGAYMLYSVNGSDFTVKLPMARKAGTYEISYKCTSLSPNYEDTATYTLTSTIDAGEDDEDGAAGSDTPLFGMSQAGGVSDDTAVPGSTGGEVTDGDELDENVGGMEFEPLETLQDILTKDPEEADAAAGNDYVEPGTDNVVPENSNADPEVNNEEPEQGNVEPQLMIARGRENVIMQVVPTVVDNYISRVGANIYDIDILDQKDDIGNSVTYFTENDKQIIRSPMTPAGTYIIEAKVKIAWIVNEEGQAQAIVLDSDIEQPVDMSAIYDGNYSYSYDDSQYVQPEAADQSSDEEEQEAAPQIETPVAVPPQESAPLDAQQYIEQEEQSDPNSEVFYEEKHEENEEQPAESAE